jgi:Predicted membrane protein
MSFVTGGGAGQTIGYQIKRQSAYISLGLIALLFPFVPDWLIVMGILFGMLGIIYMPKGSPPFKAMASEKDLEAGLLLGPLKFCGALLVLAVLVVALDFPVYLLAAVIGAVAFGEGSASIVNLLARGDRDVLWSITLLVMGSTFAFLFGAWGIVNGNYSIPAGADPMYFMFFLAVIGTVTGALLYTIVDEDDVAVPLGAGMAMWLFSSFNYTSVPDPAQLAVAVAIPFAIGIFSYKLNAVDLSGALSGVLLGLFMIVFGEGSKMEGFKWFALILVFLFLGAIFTKYKYAYKNKMGAAEANKGSRGYKNVFGNCFVPLIFVVLYGVVGSSSIPYFGTVDRSIYLIGFLCSMAMATADTLASEIGSTYKGRPRMITTLQPVPPGTDGGVSLLGEAASLLGATAIALAALLMGLTGHNAGAMVIMTILMGFAGTNIDSLLGATLQQRKLLSNAGVNFAATLITGLLAMLIYYLFFL